MYYDQKTITFRRDELQHNYFPLSDNLLWEAVKEAVRGKDFVNITDAEITFPLSMIKEVASVIVCEHKTNYFIKMIFLLQLAMIQYIDKKYKLGIEPAIYQAIKSLVKVQYAYSRPDFYKFYIKEGWIDATSYNLNSLELDLHKADIVTAAISLESEIERINPPGSVNEGEFANYYDNIFENRDEIGKTNDLGLIGEVFNIVINRRIEANASNNGMVNTAGGFHRVQLENLIRDRLYIQQINLNPRQSQGGSGLERAFATFAMPKAPSTIARTNPLELAPASETVVEEKAALSAQQEMQSSALPITKVTAANPFIMPTEGEGRNKWSSFLGKIPVISRVASIPNIFAPAEKVKELTRVTIYTHKSLTSSAFPLIQEDERLHPAESLSTRATVNLASPLFSQDASSNEEKLSLILEKLKQGNFDDFKNLTVTDKELVLEKFCYWGALGEQSQEKLIEILINSSDPFLHLCLRNSLVTDTHVAKLLMKSVSLITLKILKSSLFTSLPMFNMSWERFPMPCLVELALSHVENLDTIKIEAPLLAHLSLFKLPRLKKNNISWVASNEELQLQTLKVVACPHLDDLVVEWALRSPHLHTLVLDYHAQETLTRRILEQKVAQRTATVTNMLLALNDSRTELDLHDLNISDESLQALARFLSSEQNLERINLNGCKPSLASLCEFLYHCRGVHTIALNSKNVQYKSKGSIFPREKLQKAKIIIEGFKVKVSNDITTEELEDIFAHLEQAAKGFSSLPIIVGNTIFCENSYKNSDELLLNVLQVFFALGLEIVELQDRYDPPFIPIRQIKTLIAKFRPTIVEADFLNIPITTSLFRRPFLGKLEKIAGLSQIFSAEKLVDNIASPSISDKNVPVKVNCIAAIAAMKDYDRNKWIVGMLGQQIIYAKDNTVRLQRDEGHSTGFNHKDNVTALTPLGDNQFASSTTREVYLWDINKNSLVYHIKDDKDENLIYVIRDLIKVNDKLLLVCNFENQAVIRIWDINRRFYDAPLVLHTSRQLYSGCSLQEGLIAIGMNGIIQIRNLNTKELVMTLSADVGPIIRLAQLPDGRLVCLCQDGSIYFWDLELQGCVQKIHPSSGEKVKFILVLPNGEIILGNDALWQTKILTPDLYILNRSIININAEKIKIAINKTGIILHSENNTALQDYAKVIRNHFGFSPTIEYSRALEEWQSSIPQELTNFRAITNFIGTFQEWLTYKNTTEDLLNLPAARPSFSSARLTYTTNARQTQKAYTVESVLEQIKAGDFSFFQDPRDVTPDDVLERLDWQFLEEKRQSELLRELKDNKTAFIKLYLKNCNLTLEEFQGIVANSPNLEVLVLENVSLSSLEGPRLWGEFLKKGPLQLLKLRELRLSRCPFMRFININAPLLEVFELVGMSKLVGAVLGKIDRLSQLHLFGCPLLGLNVVESIMRLAYSRLQTFTTHACNLIDTHRSELIKLLLAEKPDGHIQNLPLLVNEAGTELDLRGVPEFPEETLRDIAVNRYPFLKSINLEGKSYSLQSICTLLYNCPWLETLIVSGDSGPKTLNLQGLRNSMEVTISGLIIEAYVQPNSQTEINLINLLKFVYKFVGSTLNTQQKTLVDIRVFTFDCDHKQFLDVLMVLFALRPTTVRDRNPEVRGLDLENIENPTPSRNLVAGFVKKIRELILKFQPPITAISFKKLALSMDELCLWLAPSRLNEISFPSQNFTARKSSKGLQELMGNGPITAFANTQEMFVSACDGALHVFAPSCLELEHKFPFYRKLEWSSASPITEPVPVTALCVLENEGILVSASQNTIQIWKGMNCITAFPYEGTVTGLADLGNGLIAGCTSTKVMIWDYRQIAIEALKTTIDIKLIQQEKDEKLEELVMEKERNKRLVSIKFIAPINVEVASQDESGEVLAIMGQTAENKSAILFWEKTTNLIIGRLNFNAKAMLCCFSKLEKNQFAFGFNNGEVQIWDLSSNELIQTLRTDIVGSPISFNQLPDGRLVVAHRNHLCIWNLKYSNYTKIISNFEIEACFVSLSGNILIANGTLQKHQVLVPGMVTLNREELIANVQLQPGKDQIVLSSTNQSALNAYIKFLSEHLGLSPYNCRTVNTEDLYQCIIADVEPEVLNVCEHIFMKAKTWAISDIVINIPNIPRSFVDLDLDPMSLKLFASNDGPKP